MPNWCLNNVQFGGTAEQVDALENALAVGVGNDDAPGLLAFFVPEPSGMAGTNWGWYDWRVENWGTKWEVAPSLVRRVGNVLEVEFESAWAPPEGVYRAAHEQGWSVRAVYWEPGMQFCGKWVDGESVYLNIDKAEDVVQYVPEVDEVFGVVNAMNEWTNGGEV